MRDITDLLKQPKPQEKLSPEEIMQRIVEADRKMINTFGKRESRRKANIGRRPWT